MQSLLSKALVLTITAVLTACASTPPPLQGPRPLAPAEQRDGFAPSPLVQATSHTQQHLDAAGRIVYSQNQGGGGAGLGVLLGPLGVAANISMIEGVTTADVARLKGRLQIDPVADFRQAATSAGWRLADTAGTGDLRATPYLLVSKTDPTTLHVGSALVLEGQAGGQPWQARYLVQLPLQYTVDSLAALDDTSRQRLQDEARLGFTALIGQLQRDSAEAAAREPRVTFQSAYLTPRFEFEQHGALIGTDAQRVWLRAVGGVYGVLPAQVRYTLVKP